MTKIKTIILLCTLVIFSSKSSPNYDTDDVHINLNGSPRKHPMYKLIAPIIRRHSSGLINQVQAQIIPIVPGAAQILPAAPPLAKSPIIQRIKANVTRAN